MIRQWLIRIAFVLLGLMTGVALVVDAQTPLGQRSCECDQLHSINRSLDRIADALEKANR